MVVRSKGRRSKTRHKLQKKTRERGMPPVTHALRTFPLGSRVAITMNPAIHRGMPHPRFQGQTGVVVDQRGAAFIVEIRDGNKLKQLIARPEHLRLIPEAAAVLSAAKREDRAGSTGVGTAPKQ